MAANYTCVIWYYYVDYITQMLASGEPRCRRWRASAMYRNYVTGRGA